MDLRQRLDRIEQLLLEACGRLEVNNSGVPSGKDVGDREACLVSGERATQSGDDTLVTRAVDGKARPVVAGADATLLVDAACDIKNLVPESDNQQPAHVVGTGVGSIGIAGHHTLRKPSVLQEVAEDAVVVERQYAAQRAAVQILQFRGGAFDVFMSCVIFVNGIFLGCEIQWSLDRDIPPFFHVLDHIFVVLFIVDLALRMLANRGYMRTGWFALECILVVNGVLTSWVLPVASAAGYVKVPGLRVVMILRLFRILRLFQILRMIDIFDSLWKLCNCLLLSARTVTCALLVISLFAYMFACFAVEFITRSDLLRSNPETNEIVELRFGSLMKSCLTLMSFTNADSVAGLYEPLIHQNPMLAPFFGLVWLIITVALMNLVTAVIVEEAITASSKDAETKRAELKKKVKSLMPVVEELFDQLDSSKDGTLELAELNVDTMPIPAALEDILDKDRLTDFFELLDDDGSGTVDKHEFIDGIMSFALQHVPIETTQTLHLLRMQHNLILDILKVLGPPGDRAARQELCPGRPAEVEQSLNDGAPAPRHPIGFFEEDQTVAGINGEDPDKWF